MEEKAVELNMAQNTTPEKEQKYRTLFETMAQGVIYQDKHGCIISANPAAERILGLTLDQMQGKTSKDPQWKSIHEDGTDFPGETHPSMVALKTWKAVNDVVMGVFNPQFDDHRWININAIPLFLDGEPEPCQVYATFDDITHQKQAETALKASAEIVKEIPSGLFVYEHVLPDKLILLDGNPAAEKLTGITIENWIGKEFNQIWPKAKKSGITDAFLNVAKTGKQYISEDLVYKDDRLEGAFKTIVFSMPKNKLGVAFENITEQKMTLEAIQRSEKRYRMLFERSNDAIFKLDKHTGRYLDANKAAEKLSGRSKAELKQLRTLDITPEGAEERLAILSSANDSVDMGEVNYVRPDGSIRTALLLNTIPLDDTVCYGIARDITDQKKAEDSLKESEKRFRTLVEESPFGISLIGKDGRYKYINPQFTHMFGYTIDDLPTGFVWLEKAFPDISYRKKALTTWIEDMKKAAAGESSLHSFTVTCNDGSRKEILFRSVTMDDRSQLVIYEDITERKSMERRLQQAQKMEAIGTLAGGIAHDFNNILSPMVGFAELLKDDISADSPLQASIDQILHAAFRARDLVQQILAFSRQADQVIKPVKLQLIVREALKLIRSSIPTTIDIESDIDPHCGVVVADPTQVHQIVMNLATNAYHAMEETGGHLKVILKQVHMDLDKTNYIHLNPGEYACLVVADTGTGIEKDNLDKIFDPYFTTKAKDKGTGLGLSVVQGIVKGAGGELHIDSQPGQGTEVQIYLPVMELRSEKDAPQTAEGIKGGHEKILLVDDEEAIVNIHQLMLTRLGYQVTTRTSSVEALAALKANPDAFDLIVTDMTMPNMTGIQLSDEIKQIREELPVILCTGFSNQINDEKCKSLGIQGYLMKPLILKDLASTIRKVLDNANQS